MIAYTIIATILGIALGYAAGMLVCRKKNTVLSNDIAALNTQVEVLKSEKLHLEQDKEQIKSEKEAVKLDAEKKIMEARKEAAEQLEKSFKDTTSQLYNAMQASTEKMLKQRQEEFAQSSQKDLGSIVNPLKETIDKMKKSMDDNTLKQTEMSSSMKTSVENMIRHSDMARKSAEELARVFKHESKVQGDWGETVLSDLLTSQGLTEGIHYDIQATIRDAQGTPIRTAEGSYLRPDVILHLDQSREVIIDSKVSLKAFFDYINSETEAEKAANLKAHLDSIMTHIKELGRKDYSSYIQPPKVKVNYVIMFVPHSAALWTAINEMPGLWRKAMDEYKVCIADEQSLYAVLNIINMTWTQIAQAENHQKVYELANEMIDRVGMFYKKYQDLGKALQTAQKTYEEGGKKLEEGGQSIIQSANKLIKLGAKPDKKYVLPQQANEEQI